MPVNHFDYIIVGNGLAGLQLALAISEDSFFNSKSIALIDVSKKQTNDKTWSFWETKKGKFSHLAYKSWKKASIVTSKKSTNLNLSPYTYKSIRSLDFYTYAMSYLNKKSNFHFIIDSVSEIIDDHPLKVIAAKDTYFASHVFDSRIPEDFKTNGKNYTTITQHFKGWVIKTKDHRFNENEITKMDYRLKDGNQTSFMYVLPFSKNEALVEFTYFTEHVVKASTYDTYLENYIKNYLGISEFEIIETEIGQIPMTTFPFYKYNTTSITKIGTAGGWVKASSGYSFKNTEKKVEKIVSNLKQNRLPSEGLFKKKYRFYDKVFLQVLKDDNHKGEWIFQEYYRRNSVKTMFRFLDEESSIFEDIKIMLSLFSFSFIKAFFKTLR